MRIHTDHLNRSNIHSATSGVDSVQAFIVSTHKSRTHMVGFEVALRGYGEHHHRRPQGRVTSDPSSEYAATYNDWGHFLASLYLLDPDMKAGPYKNADDFHAQTKFAFAQTRFAF
jgi:hypothetical protein